jgi:hypothetical protein
MKNRVLAMASSVALTVAASPAIAATCSCASVPLLGTMELASPGEGKWFLASTYEFHDVSDLVSGSSTIPDQTGRDRTSQALVLEASKGLSEKWSISALISAVDHDRKVGDSRTTSSGLGDGIIMAKYSPARISLYSRNELSVGLGARLPIGEDEASQNGIILAEDMQPSSGAYGGILWAYGARALNDSASARVYANVTYMNNGKNDREYRFGHETTASIGTSFQTQTPWGFNAELLYRHTIRDERNGTEIPNTGGQWLDFVPSAQYHLNEKMALRIAAKIPLARDLNDALQFTTKYAARLTLTYVFGD